MKISADLVTAIGATEEAGRRGATVLVPEVEVGHVSYRSLAGVDAFAVENALEDSPADLDRRMVSVLHLAAVDRRHADAPERGRRSHLPRQAASDDRICVAEESIG